MELILLASLRYKTASGSGSSSREVGLPSCLAPHFIMAQDCIWGGDEHNVGDINKSVPKGTKQSQVKQGIKYPIILNPLFNMS